MISHECKHGSEWTGFSFVARRCPWRKSAAPADIPTLTYFRPSAPASGAAVVVCPGGGYCVLAPHEADPVAQWLCSLGIAGLVLRYRVAPYQHPAPLNDAQRAIRFVRHHSQDLGH